METAEKVATIKYLASVYAASFTAFLTSALTGTALDVDRRVAAVS